MVKRITTHRFNTAGWLGFLGCLYEGEGLIDCRDVGSQDEVRPILIYTVTGQAGSAFKHEHEYQYTREEFLIALSGLFITEVIGFSVMGDGDDTIFSVETFIER